MGSRKKHKKRSKWDTDWLDLDDLFDADDLFDKLKWRGLRKQAVVDAFSKLDTSIPIVLGAVAFIAVVVLSAGPILAVLALIAFLFGVWRFACRGLAGLQKVAGQFQQMFESRTAQQQRQLADLEAKLCLERDHRTQELLVSLVQVRRSLEQDIKDGRFSVLTGDVLRHVDQVFNMCVEHLEMTYQLWQAAQGDPRDSSQKLQQREILIVEVEASVKQLQAILDHLHQRAVGSKTDELRRLRAELEQTIRIAKRVEQRTDELLHPPGTLEYLE